MSYLAALAKPKRETTNTDQDEQQKASAPPLIITSKAKTQQPPATASSCSSGSAMSANAAASSTEMVPTVSTDGTTAVNPYLEQDQVRGRNKRRREGFDDTKETKNSRRRTGSEPRKISVGNSARQPYCQACRPAFGLRQAHIHEAKKTVREATKALQKRNYGKGFD